MVRRENFADALNCQTSRGYEHEGEFGKADRAYQKAMALDPKNQQIRQNYEQFKEINDRVAEHANP